MPSTHASASGQSSHRMRVCLFTPSDEQPPENAAAVNARLI